MGSWTKIIVPFIAVAALILSGYSLFLESQRKLRIDQVIEVSKEINNRLKASEQIDSLQNIIIQMEFDKQSYTSNIELMSNWFILFESILFGIFFIVGYGIFDNKIAENKEENIASEKRINDRHIDIEKEFKDLKIRNYKDSIQLYQVVSDVNIYRNDVRSYIEKMIDALLTANEVYKLEELEKNLSKIAFLLDELLSKLKLYYRFNNLHGHGVIHQKDELMSYQREILELSNLEEKGIKELGNECAVILNIIIQKNQEWTLTGKKPVDSN